MIKVLLTGSIGAGKTTIAKVFEELGVKVFYVDDENRKALREHVVREFYEQVFGKDCFDMGTYDFPKCKLKQEFIQEFYNDSEKKAKIESFMVPYIRERLEKWYEENKNEKYVIVECAQALTLDSSGLNYDKILVVVASMREGEDFSIRNIRVKHRDGKSTDEFMKINEKQTPYKTQMEVADFVITNFHNSTHQDHVLSVTHKMQLLDDLYNKTTYKIPVRYNDEIVGYANLENSIKFNDPNFAKEKLLVSTPVFVSSRKHGEITEKGYVVNDTPIEITITGK
jgi:dephospho-CoA kinase